MATRQVGFTSACASTHTEMLSVREVCVKLEDGTTTLGYAVYLVTGKETTLLRVESEDGTILDGMVMNDSVASCTPQRVSLGTTCASINGGSPEYVEVIGVISKDNTGVVYAAKEDGKIVFHDEADVEVMLDCKCCCEGCDPCDLNPPDINYTNVDTGKIYKVWSKEIVGLTDVHITDVSGNIDFWAMSTPECSCTTELTGIAGSSSFYAVPI